MCVCVCVCVCGLCVYVCVHAYIALGLNVGTEQNFFNEFFGVKRFCVLLGSAVVHSHLPPVIGTA